jgi:hypothetical protein
MEACVVPGREERLRQHEPVGIVVLARGQIKAGGGAVTMARNVENRDLGDDTGPIS